MFHPAAPGKAPLPAAGPSSQVGTRHPSTQGESPSSSLSCRTGAPRASDDRARPRVSTSGLLGAVSSGSCRFLTIACGGFAHLHRDGMPLHGSRTPRSGHVGCRQRKTPQSRISRSLGPLFRQLILARRAQGRYRPCATRITAMLDVATDAGTCIRRTSTG
jgi:hypothetical protein